MKLNKLIFSLLASVVIALCWSNHNTCFASGLSPKEVEYKAEVIEISKAENSKAKELIVSIPIGLISLSKGDKLNVKYHHVVKGNDMFRKIGRIKIEEMLPKGKARCKVTDGHEEILRLFNQYPNSLFADL